MHEQIFAVLPQQDIDGLKAMLEEIRGLLVSMSDAYAPARSEEFVTTKRACQLLSVTPRTLATWRKKGIISVSRVGRHIYYKMSSINELIARNEIGATVTTGKCHSSRAP